MDEPKPGPGQVRSGDAQFAELDFRQADQLVQKRQRYQRRATKAGDLINYLLARKGYGQTKSQADLSQGWQAVVGEQWRGKTMAAAIRRGVLEVIVDSSAAHQQLEFKKQKLLAAIQDQLPQNKIRDIRFRVGKINR